MNDISLLLSLCVDDRLYHRYVKLIVAAKAGAFDNHDYHEYHHVLPVSLFPEQQFNDDNIVKVPGKLHYILHYLLSKMTRAPSMVTAFTCMRRLKSQRSPNCRLYHAERCVFAQLQKNRRHYVNNQTNQHVFTFEKPVGDEWVPGSPESGKGKPRGYKFWANNPITRECTTFVKGAILPTGWVRGRISSSNFKKFNTHQDPLRFCLKSKKKVISVANERWHCTDPGRSIVGNDLVYVYNNQVTLSKNVLCEMIGIPRIGSRPADFKFKPPHHNMTEMMAMLSRDHCGMGLESIGVEFIKLSDFVYEENMIGC